MELLFDRLWPINRSITGPGFRQSLDILEEYIPTERFQFQSGNKVFDWIVPQEWDVKDAYLIDPNGKKIVDFKQNNLHLVGYSVPFKGKIDLKQLKPHLYSLPDLPDAIPYVTSYYEPNWGFCISHNEFINLPDGDYQVFIDSSLYPGCVEIGEAILPGESHEEILFSTYLCHPSMANNELSGPIAMAFLYQLIKSLPNRRYTYRFAITAETIGTICFLSHRGQQLLKNLIAGYVMTCLGDTGTFTYKISRQENSLADRAAKIVLRDHGEHRIEPFDPGDNGSDERQYCSPGFNLPVGSLMRTMYRFFPEYHTSLDNKDFINFKSLYESTNVYFSIVKAIESNFVWENKIKFCEPQLGRRNLYHGISYDTQKTWKKESAAMLWLLNMADGTNDLLSIAQKSRHEWKLLAYVAQKLSIENLIEKV